MTRTFGKTNISEPIKVTTLCVAIALGLFLNTAPMMPEHTQQMAMGSMSEMTHIN